MTLTQFNIDRLLGKKRKVDRQVKFLSQLRLIGKVKLLSQIKQKDILDLKVFLLLTLIKYIRVHIFYLGSRAVLSTAKKKNLKLLNLFDEV